MENYSNKNVQTSQGNTGNAKLCVHILSNKCDLKLTYTFQSNLTKPFVL